MTDYVSLLPSFTSDVDNKHLLPLITKLEDLDISIADLLSTQPADISKRTGFSKRLVEDVVQRTVSALHQSDEVTQTSTLMDVLEMQNFVGTGDASLDKFLGGGLMTGQVIEVVGESGAGKTQFLISLLLTIQLPPHKRSSIYVSTEDILPTTRLVEMQRRMAELFPSSPTSTDHVHTILCQTPAKLELCLRYHLGIAVERFNVGLIVLDSIAANFRGEEEKLSSNRGKTLARRGGDIVRLGSYLKDLAVKHNVAVVVANQVADRFSKEPRSFSSPRSSTPTHSQGSQRQTPPSSILSNSNNNILSFDYQQRWFTGWGDEGDIDEDPALMSSLSPKTPVLGMVWTNMLDARIALLRGEEGADGRTRRWIKVVFAPWAESGIVQEFVIWDGGLKALSAASIVDDDDNDEYGGIY